MLRQGIDPSQPNKAQKPMNDFLPKTASIGQDHIWCEVFDSAGRFQEKRGALFLDRDGVIVEEVHYLHRVEDVTLIDGAAALIAEANRRGHPVVIVTNQSGLARDMFTWAEFAQVQSRMLALLKAETGAFVDAVYACPFHKNGVAPYRADNHEARKPNPGMLLRALAALPIDVKSSVIIGDKAGDLEAGQKAGLGGGIHVLSGHGRDAGERPAANGLARDDYFVLNYGSIKDGLRENLLMALS